MAAAEQDFRRGPPALLFVGYNGTGSARLRREAVDEDEVRLAKCFRDDSGTVEPCGVQDAAHLVLQHHGDRIRLQVAVSFGVGDQQRIAVLPGFVLGPVDDLTRERGGRHAVRDKPDEP
ncbi:hypothetical protein D9M72_514930 [compost metagenome]